MIATIASNNPYWKKLGGNGKPDEVVATILSVMLLARELGFSPIQAVSGGFHNIQGKFEISARLINQAIRSRGHSLQVLHHTDEMCTILGKRSDTGEEMEVTYHIAEAIRSGLVKEGGPWKKIPKDMLFARCISRIGRWLYPDCLGTAYCEGEIDDKKISESNPPELPTKDEIDITPKPIAPVTKLQIPSDIPSDRMERFIEETAEQCKKKVSEVKDAASANMVGFLSIFRKWEEKNFPVSEETEEVIYG